MDLFIIALLFIITAETTYLTVVNTKKLSTLGGEKPIFVDTSVLIDGRIVSVANSGFITGKLSIPRSVLGELQYMADQADNEKRVRARHGLDVVADLQAIPNLKVEIFQDSSLAKEGVDERLLGLAKKYRGSICTIDYNLNKVAKVQGIAVLNVNDLAMSLRMAYLPGEKIMLELTQKGHDDLQAIGHLPDGTMVVVEKASNRIGQIVEVEFIRSLQTSAGKMMFAKMVNSKIRQLPKNPVKNFTKKPRENNPQVRRKIQNRSQDQNYGQNQSQNLNQNHNQGQDRIQNQGRRSNRKYTAEDKLVDLANKK